MHTMHKTPQELIWRFSFILPLAARLPLAFWWDEARPSACFAISTLVDPDPEGAFAVTIDAEGPAVEPLAALLQEALAPLGLAALSWEEVVPQDWVSLTQANFPPLAVGRLYVHGSHLSPPKGDGRIAIRIDAGQAFGTGRHETTRLCLMALTQLAKGGKFRDDRGTPQLLDLGCGSGILAFAAAGLWPFAKLWASDNDPIAVKVAKSNAEENRLVRRVRCLTSDGLKAQALQSARPFDGIIANILAEPLVSLAGPVACALKPGGFFIASGLLVEQEAKVAAKCRHFHLTLRRRYRLNGWSALVFHRC